jgi:hypothetical protein
LGMIIPTDFHIFQRGWNHQPVDHSGWFGGWSTEVPTGFADEPDALSDSTVTKRGHPGAMLLKSHQVVKVKKGQE